MILPHQVLEIAIVGKQVGLVRVDKAVAELQQRGQAVAAGVPRADLERIVASMRAAADEAGAPFVTGDTKVMGHGELDGIVLNTTGVAITPDNAITRYNLNGAIDWALIDRSSGVRLGARLAVMLPKFVIPPLVALSMSVAVN